MLDDFGFDEQVLASVTPEECITKCKTNMFTYAALHKGSRYITMLFIVISKYQNPVGDQQAVALSRFQKNSIHLKSKLLLILKLHFGVCLEDRRTIIKLLKRPRFPQSSILRVISKILSFQKVSLILKQGQHCLENLNGFPRGSHFVIYDHEAAYDCMRLSQRTRSTSGIRKDVCTDGQTSVHWLHSLILFRGISGQFCRDKIHVANGPDICSPKRYDQVGYMHACQTTSSQKLLK